MLAGDQSRLDLRVGKGARCFLGTQASTKIYRNPGREPCGHVTHAHVEEDAVLVFAPAPVQPFAESTYAQSQQFYLAPGAGLVLLDWFTSGRPARGERWAFSHFQSRNEVFCPRGADHATNTPVSGERCVFLDSLSLDPADGPLGGLYRGGRFDCYALLLLLGPPLGQAVTDLLARTRSLALARRSPLLVSASPLDGGALLRLAGATVEQVESELRQSLLGVCSLLGDDPWARKW